MRATRTEQSVAILILMESFLQSICREKQIQKKVVAILILLESFLQYEVVKYLDKTNFKSQSLFYWNPFCNIKMNETRVNGGRSQSLFYWNPFCNKVTNLNKVLFYKSQSLFYWNPFCNTYSC